MKQEWLEGHKARKRFGQNFLHDRHWIERIVRGIDPKPGDALIEIGPGQAALTREVIACAGHEAAVVLLCLLRRVVKAPEGVDEQVEAAHHSAPVVRVGVDIFSAAPVIVEPGVLGFQHGDPVSYTI